MKTRPMHFTAEMVRALLDGTKTQTRRPVAQRYLDSFGEPDGWEPLRPGVWSAWCHHSNQVETFTSPFGEPGDTLWARERARLIEVESGEPFASGVGEARVRLRYEADVSESDWLPYPPRLSFLLVGQCVPNGVHREGARIFREVLTVRVERLHDISEADARAEGFIPLADDPFEMTAKDLFRHTWLDLYGTESWNANDWLWVGELRRVEGSP